MLECSVPVKIHRLFLGTLIVVGSREKLVQIAARLTKGSTFALYISTFYQFENGKKIKANSNGKYFP